MKVEDWICRVNPIPVKELLVDAKYFGFAERDGFTIAEWDGEHFHVPRQKFGLDTTVPYDHADNADERTARFVPMREVL